MTTASPDPQVHLDDLAPSTSEGQRLALELLELLAGYGLSPRPLPRFVAGAEDLPGPGIYVRAAGDGVVIVWHAEPDEHGVVTTPFMATLAETLRSEFYGEPWEGESVVPAYTVTRPDAADAVVLAVHGTEPITVVEYPASQ